MDEIFDIVNNKICPFCHSELLRVGVSMAGSTALSYYQCDSHLEIGYDHGEWNVIRVSPLGFQDLTFYRWYRSLSYNDTNYNNLLIKQSALVDVKTIASIPVFNIFNYSLPQLANKIKMYTLFS
jgi:hypothetical protein